MLLLCSLLSITNHWSAKLISKNTIQNSIYITNCQSLQVRMTSFDISDSSITNEQKSFNTLQLLTESRELSPIRELNSQIQSDMKPEILFQAKKTNNKQLSKYIPPQKEVQPPPPQNLIKRVSIYQILANQEIYQSFEIASPYHSPPKPKPEHDQQDSILLDDCDCEASITDSLFASAITKHLNIQEVSKIPVQLSVSRHLLVDKDGQVMSGKLCLNRFLCQFKELQSNIQKLQSVIDRININDSVKETRVPSCPKPKECRSIVKPVTAVLQMTVQKSKGLSIQAKSTRSEQINMTPCKQMPYVSEFRLNEDVPKCELDNMSPISTSKKKERSLNVDESSSSLLMRKKFSRRCEDEHA